jgi:hypothetical protein
VAAVRGRERLIRDCPPQGDCPKRLVTLSRDSPLSGTVP